MKDTCGNPSDGERGRLGPGREDAKEGVDSVFLAHQDGEDTSQV